MANTFSVAISYNNHLGWIDFDESTHTAVVNLNDETGKKLVEDYLKVNHTIRIPHKTLMDFTDEDVTPLADLQSFQLALTRLWNETKVHVDWSRPVDYVKEHNHY